MTHALRVRPKARIDLADAARWYEAQRTGLGRQFIDEVEAAFATVARQPLLCAEIYRGARRALLRSFPFGNYYRIAGNDVSVIAVLHTSRHPDRWMIRE